MIKDFDKINSIVEKRKNDMLKQTKQQMENDIVSYEDTIKTIGNNYKDKNSERKRFYWEDKQRNDRDLAILTSKIRNKIYHCTAETMIIDIQLGSVKKFHEIIRKVASNKIDLEMFRNNMAIMGFGLLTKDSHDILLLMRTLKVTK